MLAVYATVAAAAVVIGTWAPLIYWLIPRALGEPVQRSIRVAEHKGCEEGPDVRTNTRSTRTNAVFRALCWNMPYHSEHHLCPAAPFHKLPALSRAVAHKLKPMGESYLAVDREVRKRFIVSEAEAKRIVSQRMALAGDWQCHLD